MEDPRLYVTSNTAPCFEEETTDLLKKERSELTIVKIESSTTHAITDEGLRLPTEYWPIMKQLLSSSLQTFFTLILISTVSLEVIYLSKAHLKTDTGAYGPGQSFVDFEYNILLGIGTGVNILCAKAIGAKFYKKASDHLFKGFVVTLVGCFFFFAFAFCSRWVFFEETGKIRLSDEISMFLFFATTQVALLGFAECFRGYEMAHQKYIFPLIVSIGYAGLDLLLCYIAVDKLGMGLKGIGIVRVITATLCVLCHVIYCTKSASLQPHWQTPTKAALSGFWKDFEFNSYLALIAASEGLAAEVTMFMLSTLPEKELAAQSLAFGFIFIFWTAPIAFPQTLSSYISTLLGANQEMHIKKYFKAGLTIGLAVSLIGGGIVLATALFGSHLFTDDPEVAKHFQYILYVFTVITTFEIMMNVLSFTLRALEMEKEVLITVATTIVLIGLPAQFLALEWKLGAVGVWLGYGLNIQIATIVYYVLYRRKLASISDAPKSAKASLN